MVLSMSLLLSVFVSIPVEELDSPPASTNTYSIAKELEHGELVMRLDFHPKKPLLATLRRDGIVELWNTKKWKSVAKLSSPDSEGGAIRFSPNGRLLAAGGRSGFRVWGVDRGWKVIRNEEFGIEINDVLNGKPNVDIDEASSIGFSPDGRTLFVGGDSQQIFSWDTKSWQQNKETLRHSASKHQVVPELPEGSLPPGVPRSALLEAGCSVDVIAVAKKKRVIASGGATHALRLWKWSRARGWHLAQAFEEKPAPAPPCQRMDARFSRDGSLLAVANGDGRLEIIDVKTGTVKHDIQANEDAFVTSVEFSEDGKLIFATGQHLKVWNAETGKLVDTVELPSIARLVRLSPKGNHLVLPCEDQVTRVVTWEERK